MLCKGKLEATELALSSVCHNAGMQLRDVYYILDYALFVPVLDCKLAVSVTRCVKPHADYKESPFDRYVVITVQSHTDWMHILFCARSWLVSLRVCIMVLYVIVNRS